MERLLAAILVPDLVGKRRAHKARHPRTGEAIRVCNPFPYACDLRVIQTDFRTWGIKV